MNRTNATVSFTGKSLSAKFRVRFVKRALAAAAIVAAALVSGSAWAAPDTWTGGGGDDNWLTALNWSPGSTNAPPLTQDSLTFSGSTQLTANNNYTYSGNNTITAGNSAFDGISFASGAGAFNLT